MKRPVIGITASHDTEHDKLFINSVYLRAIRNAGGIPMIFPMEVTEDDLRDLVTLTDGVLFTGGTISIRFSMGRRPTPNAATSPSPEIPWRWPLFPW